MCTCAFRNVINDRCTLQLSRSCSAKFLTPELHPCAIRHRCTPEYIVYHSNDPDIGVSQFPLCFVVCLCHQPAVHSCLSQASTRSFYSALSADCSTFEHVRPAHSRLRELAKLVDEPLPGEGPRKLTAS
eukprot:4605965-Amphidinium_carterae.1